MYSIRNTVELISTYQYPEGAQQAALSKFFLHVITRSLHSRLHYALRLLAFVSNWVIESKSV